MKNEKLHSSLLGLVGGYILILAWQLYEKYRDGTKEVPDAVFLAGIIVFTLGGIGTLIWAWKIYRKQREEEAKTDAPESGADTEQKKDKDETPGQNKNANV